MPIYAALLRAVNVGGTGKVKMDELRTMFDSIGLGPAVTYVQSGNVVFQSKSKNVATLAAQIETAIESHFGFRTVVILRSQTELLEIVKRNPFNSRKELEPAKLLVSFLAERPTEQAQEKLSQIPISPEELILDGREIFTYYPDGQGKSKLPHSKVDRALGTPGTGRNWNTVLKLVELAEELTKG
jgi:uncharacterized protein (DUF1697 family)